ncbi:MAG: hypothetical protein ACSHX3_08730 [Litorimonas sp.]
MSKRIYTVTSAFTVLLMTGFAAAAQTSDPAQQIDILESETKKDNKEGVETHIKNRFDGEVSKSQNLVSGSLMNSETAGGIGPSAQLSFTTEGSSASFKLASGGNEKGPKCINNDDNIRSCRTSTWNLIVSTPFDSKDDTLLDLATLDGLASGVNATFKYSLGRTGGVDINMAEAESLGIDIDLITAREACIIDEKRNGGKRTDDEIAKCRTTTRYTAHSKDGKFPEDADDLIDEYIPKGQQARDTVFKNAYSYFINFEGKVNYEDFDFIDPTDLSSESTEKFEYSAGISATYVTLGERQIGITTGVKFQSDFKQADEGINCLNDMGEISCVSGRPLAPERKESLLGFSEVRHIFNNVPGLGKVGVAPRLTHDFDEGVTGVNLPIFLASGDGNLSSGFQVGWRSDTDEVVAGFFIGTQLSLFQARE